MKKYSIYLWAFVALVFVFFIGLMSYWYPVTLDEYFRWGVPFKFEMLTDAYFKMVPRISLFFIIPIFALGKWSFVLLNPLVQLANCLCIFYILFVRFPNIKDFKDMPYFLIIIFMSIFFVCHPSQVMFWVAGAVNYTWTNLFFLLMLCFLRLLQTNKMIFKDNWVLKICLFMLGFLIGMSNECIAPIALGFVVFLGVFWEYKKIKTPWALSFLIFGLAIGCLAFFSAPAHYSKMSWDIVSKLSAVSLGKKLFFHIFHFDEFFKAQFYMPFVIIVLLIIAFVDKNKKIINKEDLWNSLFTFLIALAMAFILFAAPHPPVRAYYSASVLVIISFLFLVKYYIQAYKFDFSKWLCYVIVVICLFLSPRFILPHYSLYLQEKTHAYWMNRPMPIEMTFWVLAGPTRNLSIGLMDPARRVDVGDNFFITDTSPLTKW